jgi:antitoxin (DNA-binding transcriptional repressor) of toxin-antitoxin stability system
MNTITVRDLRQRWPAAERLLEAEHELIITRDGRPIARLVRLTETTTKRRRFDPQEHGGWQRQVFGQGTTIRWAQAALESGRRDRGS